MNAVKDHIFDPKKSKIQNQSSELQTRNTLL